MGDSFLRRLEKGLFRLIIVGFLLLATLQILRGSGNMLSNIEGIPTTTISTLPERYGVLTLESADNSSLPKVKVLVNRKPKGDLTYQEVTLRVKEGDLIEIDAREYPLPIRIKVSFASSDLLWPPVGMEISLSGELKKISDVVFKK